MCIKCDVRKMRLRERKYSETNKTNAIKNFQNHLAMDYMILCPLGKKINQMHSKLIPNVEARETFLPLV